MSATYNFGPFSLDARRLTLAVHGRRIALAPKVVHTLAILVERGGALVTKRELMDLLWPQGFVEEGNLTQNIYVLRRTLREHGLEPSIENVPKRGYRFVAPMRQTAAPAKRGRAIAAAAAALVAAWMLLPQHAPAPPADEARLYAIGRYYWSLRTPEGLARARVDFERIARTYPRSALGYAGLADTYTEVYDYVCDGRPCAPAIAKAQEYARKALAAGPNSAEAHTSAGMTARLFEHDLVKSDAEFKRALALDPRNALAHEWYGNSLLARGNIRGARQELQQAVLLEPVSVATYAWLARDDYYEHRYADAVANAREALAINPGRIETTIVLGLALEQQGDAAGAIRAFGRVERLGGSKRDARALIAGVYARLGERARALRSLPRGTSRDNPADGYVKDAALAFIAAGDYADALTWLRHVRFAGEMERTFFALDPRLDAVRADVRFRRWAALAST